MSERDIFIAARTKTNPSSQAVFLDEACAGDVAVRQRVERLLRADGEHDSLVDEPAVELSDVDQTVTGAFDSSLVVGANADRRDDKEWLHMLSASSRPDSLGRIGHYEVLEFLGTGGFSIVLRALDTNLNRMVAVKLLAPQLASSASSRQRFLREARSAAAVRHENVVQVYAVEEQPLPYLVMEFVPGETLQQRLDRIGRLPMPDVIEIGRQIAEGLAAAHATGLIHRDVKPANVFLEQATGEPGGVSPRTSDFTQNTAEQVRGLTPAGSPSTLAVKLLDFGLARAVDDVSITQSGMIIGTPLYMSPEQARSESLDHRTDLFSLGSVLYAMTTGRSPFRADNTLATLKRVSEETPQPIQELVPGTPRWLCDLITKLLAKNPTERIPSAREVAELLVRCEQWDIATVLEASPVAELVNPVAELARVRTTEGEVADLNRPGTEVWRLRLRRVRVTVAALMGMIALVAIVLSLPTPNGEVIVEIPNDVPADVRKQIKIEVGGDGNLRVANEANGWAIGVKEGKYDVQLSGGGDRVQIDRNQVAVTRGKKTIVTVTLKPDNVGNINSTADAPPPAIAPFDADQAKQHQAAWAKHLDVPIEYTNSIGMKFVLIPPGEFTMGSPPAEIEAHLKEVSDAKNQPAYYFKQWQERIQSAAPQHKVVLTQPIYLGITEVTQKQYETIMGTNPAHFSATGAGKEAVANLDTQNHPVEMVTWNDAAEFCARLSESEKRKPSYFRVADAVTPLAGNGYRLPTEAEWEFACRAGTTTKFWNGDSDEDRIEVGWTSHSSGSRPHAVGELRANPFGLFDVHGNLFEWVEDAWDPKYYAQFSEQAAINPAVPNPARRPCVIRGGSWGDPANLCRASTRHAYHPLHSFGGLGFRVSLPVDAVKESLTPNRKPTDNASADAYLWPADAPSPAIAPFDAGQAKAHQEAWSKHLDVPVEYSNSIGMKFVLIPPGEFLMGSTSAEIDEAHRIANYTKMWQQHIQCEAPRHKVILTQPMYLGAHEVTQKNYTAVMGTNPSQFSSTGLGKELVANLDTQNHPVEMVNWNDATEFCAALSRKENLKPFSSRESETAASLIGTGYRLPTEAEWEFACRAGSTTAFWIGERDEDLVRAAWIDTNSGERTHAVGERQRNPLGLFDIHGNVWEWVHDGWYPTFYNQFADRPAINPTAPATGSLCVIRGGDSTSPATFGRSTFRGVFNPSTPQHTIGFRVSLTVAAVKASLQREPR